MKIFMKILAAIILILAVASGVCVYRCKTMISEMFKMNGKLQAEGYYMGEFEFKMLGIAYYLDKGQYYNSFSRLSKLHEQLKTREGLIKVPDFADQKAEMDFYLSLQNPRTGAFMDESYPVIFYLEPTLNMVEHLEQLARETGQPLRLKYPLVFLEEVNTPDKLRAVLNEVSTVGLIGARLPKTNYMMASCYHSYDILEHNQMYSFTPEWKEALLQWFYDNQDDKTGYWGARLRSNGELLDEGDLSPTYKIVTLFVDSEGNNIYPQFPLRYQPQMLATTLRKISQPMPADADLAEIHEWQLTRYHGIKLLTKYLWNGVSLEDKNTVEKVLENIIQNKFAKFFVEQEGAFSYYPNSKEATLDGTGDMIAFLYIMGAFSADEQQRLWGSSNQCLQDLGVLEVNEANASDWVNLMNPSKLNSIRFFRNPPVSGDYTKDVVAVCYPYETRVLDIMDLLPQIKRWLNTTPQKMGNWTSKEAVKQEINVLPVEEVPVYKSGSSLDIPNNVLHDNQEMVIIGFDVLQVPRYKLVLRNRVADIL